MKKGKSRRNQFRPLQIRFPSGDEAAVFKCLNASDRGPLIERLLAFASGCIKSVAMRGGLDQPEHYVQDAINNAQWLQPGETAPTTLRELSLDLIGRIRNAVRRDAYPHSITINGQRRYVSEVEIEAVTNVSAEGVTPPPDTSMKREMYRARIQNALERLEAAGVPKATIVRLQSLTSVSELATILAEFRDNPRTAKSGQARIDGKEYAKALGISARTAFRDIEEIRKHRLKLPSYQAFVGGPDDDAGDAF